MIKNLDPSSSIALIPLLVDLGYPNQDAETLHRRIEHFLSNSNSWIYGYIDNDELIGFGSLSFIPLIHEDGYLARVSALAVKKSCQSKGIGKRLMSHMESICRAKDCSRIELTSGAHRESIAHRFYLRIGYEKSGGARFVKTLVT
ncbi:MAG: GNAT family N-acetyltransferase [Pseudobdellovibrionaceae bacterium]